MDRFLYGLGLGLMVSGAVLVLMAPQISSEAVAQEQEINRVYQELHNPDAIFGDI